MENALAEKNRKGLRPMTIIKIVLDVLMAVTFILLMDAKIISMAFHEIAGLAIGGVILIHKLLNWKWIKNVTRNIFGRRVAAQTRLRYIVDVLLFIGVYLIIISGALISEYVFTSAVGGGSWKTIHTTTSYICIPLIGIHIGLHVKWITNAFRRMLHIVRESKVRKWALRAASMALAVWGIVTAVTSGFFGKIAGADTHFSSEGSTSGLSADAGDAETSAGTRAAGSDSTEDEAAVSGSDESGTVSASLEEFLSGLTCTACHKNCSLLNPQCGRGRQQQQEATAEYESMSADTAEDTSATVYTQDGASYLSVGTAVYTLSEASATVTLSTEAELDTDTSEADQTQTDTELKGGGQGGGKELGEGRGESSSGFWSTLLTWVPIMWLFGVVGWAASLLAGRKRKRHSASAVQSH